MIFAFPIYFFFSTVQKNTFIIETFITGLIKNEEESVDIF